MSGGLVCGLAADAGSAPVRVGAVRIGPGPGGPRPGYNVGGPFLLCPARPGTATMPCYSCQDSNN